MKLLNHNSPIPLYHQLAEILESRIKSGVYKAGQKIPSEPQLSQTFGIGRPTVRQAVETLTRKSILEKRKGSGTFVCDNPVEINLLSMAGTTSAFFEKGKEVESRIIEPTRLVELKRDKENPFNRSKAFYFSRLTLVDRLPVLYEDIYLHPELFPNFDEIEIANQSLARIVKDVYFMVPNNFKQTYTVISVDAEKAHWLDLGVEAPLLLVNRHINFKQCENAIFSRIYCRTDRFVFSQTIEGNGYE